MQDGWNWDLFTPFHGTTTALILPPRYVRIYHGCVLLVNVSEVFLLVCVCSSCLDSVMEGIEFLPLINGHIGTLGIQICEGSEVALYGK